MFNICECVLVGIGPADTHTLTHTERETHTDRQTDKLIAIHRSPTETE